ncbi:hypothetical protein Y032_0070g419 [Ancylostoma ceylanicum]|uniref:Uncharacterized protein n=1 Tax=Ancylostoma ceylanicum TaxID=53326 RepID=A0A016TWI9_9BILA|nr:hypothetical protein Y032_0070g419 [Ancylostoma ceylanicum]
MKMIRFSPLFHPLLDESNESAGKIDPQVKDIRPKVSLSSQLEAESIKMELFDSKILTSLHSILEREKDAVGEL